MLFTVSQIRELEKIASEDELMLRAGKAAVNYIQERWPKKLSIAVVCGKGNNAGDGYVIARLLHEREIEVTVLYLYDPGILTKSARKAYLSCKEKGVKIVPYSSPRLWDHDLIVDAIFGIGFSGTLSQDISTAIAGMNDSGLPILAVDMPSGLDVSTQKATSDIVQATATITFIGYKVGMFGSDARRYCGYISCDELGLPRSELLQQKPLAMIADFDELLATNLPARRMSSHKGDFGHVLIIGGDYGMPGAVRMAAEAAARVGAGVVSVVTRPEHILAVNIGRPELMVHGINEIKKSENFAKLLDKADVVVLGPGLGRSIWSEEIMELVLKTEKPLVVDADALNYLAENQSYRNNWIITPHPGEAARLLNCATQEIQQNRFKSVQMLQKKYGGVCVLKGAASLVWDGESDAPTICNAGNPGMASGGMGDVLSGVIGGLLAQKLSLNKAAILGVLLHAHAGDKAAKESGERGLLATDLFPYLRKLVNDY